MRCTNCGNLCSLDDNFCRKCGASLRNVRVPAARNGSQLPVVWRGMLPVVARSAAVFALSALVPVLLRMTAKRALHLPSLLARPLPAKKKSRELAATRKDDHEAEGTVAIRETFLLRRITFRR
jgi:hypothetical protein